MELFKTSGWDLKGQVAFGGGAEGKKPKGEKRLRKKRSDMRVGEILAEAAGEVPETLAKLEKLAKLAKLEKLETPGKAGKSKKLASTTKPPSKKRKVESSDEAAPAPASAPTPAPTPAPALTPLQQKMMAKLSGSRFRWINEQLYTMPSDAALKLIHDQPSLFDEYHQGFRLQVALWPENPVNVFVRQLKDRAKKPVNAPGGLPGLGMGRDKKVVIADMGCGEAQLAKDIAAFAKQQKPGRKQPAVNFEVHSFDLKAPNPRVTVADIRNVPLADNLASVVVFCLALMGTNFLDFVEEAFRILAPRGELWIAEIKLRFGDGKGDEFVEALKLCGFFHKSTDDLNLHFTRFEFFKPSPDVLAERVRKLERKKRFVEQELAREQLDLRRQETPEGTWLLKPCIYKRR